MDLSRVQDVVTQLNDAELAILVCLVAEQHCIIRADDSSLDKLQYNLQRICSNTFGLTSACIDFGPDTTLEDFGEAVVTSLDLYVIGKESAGPASILDVDFISRESRNILDNRKVANVVIAKNLNQASYILQIQALELMRSRRIYSAKAVHAVPKRFLFIALISNQLSRPPLLTPYLNDYFFISHMYHPSTSTYIDSPLASETASMMSQSSVIHKNESSAMNTASSDDPLISESVLSQLQTQISQVRLSAEIRRYIHNIVTFMRLHRAVAGGISAISSRHLTVLSRVLAPFHGLNYVSPSLVALAVRKVYPHRIEITVPEDERSMQWGSDLDAVAKLLDGVSPEEVIDDVLEMVEVPL